MSVNTEFTGEQQRLREKALTIAARLVGSDISERGFIRLKKVYIFILGQLQGEPHQPHQGNQHKDSESGESPS